MVAEGKSGAIRQYRRDVGTPGDPAGPHAGYSVQKSGPHSLTKALAIEFAPHAIRVDAIASAVVKTPPHLCQFSEEELDPTENTFASMHPLGGIGTAEDIANMVSFLLSDKAS